MTNKQVYERALELVDSTEICWSPIKYSGLGVCEIISEIIEQCYFPSMFIEWEHQRPKDSYNRLWWPIEDRESRKQALLKAIQLCD